VEAKQIDPGEFRSGQKEAWNGAAGGWNKWQELVEKGASKVSERMVELAGVEAGNRVLDVGAGYGEPSLTAAKAVGPEGTVVATDISAEMLSYARDRAAKAGVENMEFEEIHAGALDFPHDSFDAALSRWGIIFDPDGEGAAGRVRKALKPGSKMAISSWATPDRVPMLAVAIQTALKHLNEDPPPKGMPGPLSRPTPEAIAGLLEGGGFSDVEVEEIEVVLTYDSAEDYAKFIHEIAPPVNAIIDPHGPDKAKETWEAITEAAREEAAEDGSVTHKNLALLAAGRA
jgi:SAM-dependent methyltransferase